jgi:hypothetical protein
MRITVLLKRQSVTALVDSNSTHKFVHPEVVWQLRCEVQRERE